LRHCLPEALRLRDEKAGPSDSHGGAIRRSGALGTLVMRIKNLETDARRRERHLVEKVATHSCDRLFWQRAL
jgi:hypothetical protein